MNPKIKIIKLIFLLGWMVGCRTTELTDQPILQVDTPTPSLTSTTALTTPIPPASVTSKVLPPSPTETYVLLTDTAIPLTGTPIAESKIEGARVTFVNNDGFLITVGDKRILIDALYEGYPEGVLKPVVYAQPPFDEVDVMLVTHEHLDHFSPSLVLRYLQNNPKTMFVSTQGAIEQILAADSSMRDRVIPIQLERGESEQMMVNGISLEALHLSHGQPGLLNLGFVITVGQLKFFHTGDISPDDVRASYLRSFDLGGKQIDVEFVPYFFMTQEDYHPYIWEDIQPKYIIPMHHDYQEPPLELEASFPNAIVFKNTLESWMLPMMEEVTQKPTLTPTQIQPYETIEDLTYVNGDPVRKLSLYIPSETKRRSLVLMVQSGEQFPELVQYFAELGYPVVAFDTRDNSYQEEIQDVFCALAWTRANADTYGYDETQIVPVGISMFGGNAALLSLVENASSFLEECPFGLPENFRVRAVITLAGVFDYSEVGDFFGGFIEVISTFMGGSPEQVPEAWLAASAITWVKGKAPPYLLVHGRLDTNVSLRQSEKFAAALEEVDTKVELVLLAGVNHNNIVRNPKVLEAMQSFLESLKENP